MDGITFYHIAKELNARLAGGRVDKIQQPERDVVVITLRCVGENLMLLLSASADCGRAQITSLKQANPLEPPQMCMLMRKHLPGGRLMSVKQLHADRVLQFEFEHTDELGDRAKKYIICEFMGKHSNIILLSGDGKIMECARHINETVSSFREVLPGLNYLEPPAHGKLNFDSLTVQALEARIEGQSGELAKVLRDNISGLSLPLARELSFRLTGDTEARTDNAAKYAAKAVAFIRDILDNPSPRIILSADGEAKELLAFECKSRSGAQQCLYPSLSEAAEEFYRLKDTSERLKQKSATLHHTIKQNIDRLQKKLSLQQEAFDGAARSEEYRVKGEMLTASPYLVQKGMKTVSLPNYYDENCGTIEVELDEKLNATANAQRYFKLYKKAQVARKLAKEQLEKGGEELNYLETLLYSLSAGADEASLAEIRDELIKSGYIKDNLSRRQVKALPPSAPMSFTSPDGTLVLVGRNNIENEKLTFGASPDEIWLHAKNVPGSHVIIKSTAPTEDTIIFAARLAALYCAAGTSTHVEVDYLPRRFVKKPAGSRPGFVTFTHQTTVSVKPAEGK